MMNPREPLGRTPCDDPREAVPVVALAEEALQHTKPRLVARDG
jgi:hypothetical protein